MNILMTLFWIFVVMFVICTIGWAISVVKKNKHFMEWGIAANGLALLINLCNLIRHLCFK